jgi:hypothetical protein
LKLLCSFMRKMDPGKWISLYIFLRICKW